MGCAHPSVLLHMVHLKLIIIYNIYIYIYIILYMLCILIYMQSVSTVY